MKVEGEWERCYFKASISWKSIFVFGLSGISKQIKLDRKLVRLSLSKLQKLFKIWSSTPNFYAILLADCEFSDQSAFL